MLTPEEIQSREFLVSLRGYDRDEVHAFLDEVAESFATLLAGGVGDAGRAPVVEPAAVADPGVPDEPAAPVDVPTAAVEPPVSPFAAIGVETQRILDAAQSAGEEILARAQDEATRAREAALAEADAEVAALGDQAAATQRVIDVLELRQAEIADRLRQARDTAELALLEVEGSDPDDIDPDDIDLVDDDVSPVDDDVSPVEEAVVPVDDDVSPVDDDVSPVEEAVVPVDEDVDPLAKG